MVMFAGAGCPGARSLSGDSPAGGGGGGCASCGDMPLISIQAGAQAVSLDLLGALQNDLSPDDLPVAPHLRLGWSALYVPEGLQAAVFQGMPSLRHQSKARQGFL